MASLRFLIARYRLVAVLLLGIALAGKLAIPVGFMPTVSDGTITLSMCTGSGPQTVTITLDDSSEQHPADPAKAMADMPCAFAGLSMLATMADGTAVVVAAIAFAITIGFAARRYPAPRTIARHLPPSHGPPATA